ncbi:hypothetical protein SAY86_023330 [Trapa natans]|uniref:PPM-type phosphatase domain-containing protein n=1 Tax=Trapa natans TaxID=22666 RepID=A0AAN7MAJ6_TRANT|nr:hypothetical protein SAY86_023330 [Trapa natans]
MGNSTSRVVGCFVPNGKAGVDLEFSEPLDEGLGHSFCYVRPTVFDSPAITPSNSARFTLDSSTLDSETVSRSFRNGNVEDSLNLSRPSNNKNFAETTFRTISGASVSANVSTARTGNATALFATDVQEPAASFESTASFAAIPLQPIPRSFGPLNGFMSGPLERGFASGPLDRVVGFMSGPIERETMSGPLDATDKYNFLAPLSKGHRRSRLQQFMRSVSGPMRSTISRTFSRTSVGSHWMRRFFLQSRHHAWNLKESILQREALQDYLPGGPSEGEYASATNLQWAHGKAGEDRVHVVLSEEQGWLFIGIYDGFSGPDAPDFLMGHLYKAIDKELEGLLWDYECKSSGDHTKPDLSQGISSNSGETSDTETVMVKLSNCKIGMEKKENLSTDSDAVSVGNISQGKKSVRLYELLQLELKDEHGSNFMAEFGTQRRRVSWDSQQNSNITISRKGLQTDNFRQSSLNFKDDSSTYQADDPPTTSGGENCDIENDSVQRNSLGAVPASSQWHNPRKFLIGSKIRRMYRKQKSLRKKLFPWSYDWHREEENYMDERPVEQSVPTRRCISRTVDHGAILCALEKALQSTEEAYMDMVEKCLDKTPELALMGSCVLVMLMKDQDVYVMNVGDSRVILAQERPIPNLNFGKDDLRHRNRSRESLVRMELDRISEESPMHNPSSQIHRINKNKEIAMYKLRMRAVQLSTDHCTSIEEEVLRVKSEHPDDNQAVMNDRVKGQLKVTRAFGAGFLKKPTFNEPLLEMFRVNYLGAAPYLSCIPSVLHYRLSSIDRFLVLSSDGLYQYFSNEEVVAHVAWFIENVPEGDPAQYLVAELLFRAAEKNGMNFHELLDIPHGDRRKYHDDVSVMVVSLEGRIWKSTG